MSISSTTDKIGPFVVSGLPQVIPVSFPFQAGYELIVYDTGASGTTNDPALTLTLNSDFTVAGGGYDSANTMQTGSITVSASGANDVQVGDYLVIARNVPINQTTSFQASGPLTIQMVEQALDKQGTLSQQVNEVAGRALRFEASEFLDGTLLKSARAGKLLGFDADGNISFSTDSTGSGGSYTAGAGLALSSNEFSVLPDQTFDNLTVTNPILGDLTGNADTATALETPRNINGVPFDGTAAITVAAAASTLTGTTLAANVVSSSLTSVAAGTIGTMVLQNANAVAITGGTITGTTVTGLANGTNPSDAVNLSQLQGVSAGITLRTGVVAATTANITLSAPQTIDGQAVIAGNRILVKNQTLPAENGIYVVAAGAWSRATDSDTAAELLVGYTYFVSSGTVNGASTWSINVAPTVLNTDPVGFVQFSASQAYSAGTGLNLTGNVFSIASTQSGLAITGSTFAGSFVGNVTGNGSITSTGLGVFQSSGGIITGISNDGTYGLIGTNSANSLRVLVNTTPIGLFSSTGLAVTGTFSSSSDATQRALHITGPLAVAVTADQLAIDQPSAGVSRIINVGPTAPNYGVIQLAVAKGDATGQITVGSISSAGLAVTGTLTNTVADATIGLFAKSASGLLRVTPYFDSTYGALVESTNAAGSVSQPITFIGTTIRQRVGSVDISTANSNGISVVGGVQQTGVFNVRNYGAVGNGSSNDTSAIAAAFAAAKAYHGTVYFPAGVYMTDAISVTGCVGLTIYGDGIGVSKIKARSASQVLNLSSSSSINVYGLTFDGSCTVRTAGQQAVQFDTTVGLDFHNNEIINSGEFAIMVGYTSASNVRVDSNLIGANWADGINIQNVTDYVISNNIVSGADDDCIAVNGTRGIIIGNKVRHRSDSITATGRGIWSGFNATDLLIEGNLIDSTKQHGIFINQEDTNKMTRIKIIGNVVKNAPLVSGQPIALIGTQDCTVENNTVYDPPIVVSGLIEIANWDNLKISGNKLYQRTNSLFARGIHVDESVGYADVSWTDLTLKNNEIYLTGNSTNSGIYLQPFSPATWGSGGNYTSGTYLIYLSNVYICTVSINPSNTPPSVDTGHFSLIGSVATVVPVMDTVIIDSNTVKQRSGVGNYISLSGTTTTMGKIFNNSTMTAGETITPSTGGVFTVSNNY